MCPYEIDSRTTMGRVESKAALDVVRWHHCMDPIDSNQYLPCMNTRMVPLAALAVGCWHIVRALEIGEFRTRWLLTKGSSESDMGVA